MIKLFNNQLDKLDNDDNNKFLNKHIKIQITWRFIFYLLYMAILYILISLALVDHYEHRLFMMGVWVMFTASYPMSIFLIQWRTE